MAVMIPSTTAICCAVNLSMYNNFLEAYATGGFRKLLQDVTQVCSRDPLWAAVAQF